MSKLLTDIKYLDFLAQTHPELHMKRSMEGLPSFVVPIASFQPLLPGVLRNLAYLGKFVVPSLLNPKALVFGVPFEPYEQTAVLPMLPSIKTIKNMAHDIKADLVLIANINKKSFYVKELVAEGFFVMPSFPDMRISVNGKEFNGYLNTLPGKYRRSVRQNINNFELKNHKLVYQKDITFRLSNKFYDAYKFMRQKALVPWIPYNRAYFCQLHEKVPQAFVVAACSEQGELLGMAQGFKDANNFHVARVATTKTMAHKDGVFFRLTYACIEEALKQGCQEIALAPTSYAFKKRLKAQFYPLNNLIMPISFSWKSLMTVAYPQGFDAFLSHLDSQAMLEKFF